MPETATLTLTDFLLARIAEDEQDAQAFAKEIGRWHREKALNGADGSQGSIALTAVFDSASDPARVLAECEAKRQIVEKWQTFGQMGIGDWRDGYAAALGDSVRILASVCADHPDYRDEWRP